MLVAIKTVIVAAAIAHGVNASAMLSTAGCESGFDPFNDRNPPYVGLYQLGPGLQRWFYARGYDNLHDPAQQSNFVAGVIISGGVSNWPTWGRICIVGA